MPEKSTTPMSTKVCPLMLIACKIKEFENGVYCLGSECVCYRHSIDAYGEHHERCSILNAVNAFE